MLALALKCGGGHQIVSFDEFKPEAEASMLATCDLDDNPRHHGERQARNYGLLLEGRKTGIHSTRACFSTL